MDGWMNNLKAICPSNFFEVGDIKSTLNMFSNEYLQHVFIGSSPLIHYCTINPSNAEHDMPCFSKQCRSEEANWSRSALFVIKYVNFYQKPESSNLIGWKLEVTAWEGLRSPTFQKTQLSYEVDLSRECLLLSCWKTSKLLSWSKG